MSEGILGVVRRGHALVSKGGEVGRAEEADVQVIGEVLKSS